MKTHSIKSISLIFLISLCNIYTPTFITASITKYEVSPFGKITDSKTGKAIKKAKIMVYDTNIHNIVENISYTDDNGYFSFNPIQGVKWGYRIIFSAEGYGSKWINGHTTVKGKELNIQLEKSDNQKTVNKKHFGKWIYSKNAKGDYIYTDGEAYNSDDKFFHRSTEFGSLAAVEKLKKEIGLSNNEISTDKEIFDEFKKIWNFWRTHTRDMYSRDPKVKQCMNCIRPESLRGKIHYTSIEEYAKCYEAFGFFVMTNCTGTTKVLANIIALSNIPKDKIAISIMHPSSSAKGEHWSIIIKLKNKWYWADPFYTRAKCTNLESFHSISNRSDMFYTTPFKIMRFPGNNDLKTPLCSAY
ncbi:MAG: carboxypeptidase-like regulatory domain-containing protein [Marinifilaceae bacterium]|jgi:hypothetical protein|nr:carboxypeptidase-like regulatory domain-containing protein [Marinifilaceae bacterium]